MKSDLSNTKKTKKKFVKHLFEIALFLLLLIAIVAWQERHLLNRQTDSKSSQITLPSLEGETYQLAKSKQKQLIYFFAPWCNICHLSISNIEAQKTLLDEKNIEILYVALSWQDKNEIIQFSQEHQLSSPVLLGTKEVMQAYKVKGFPTYYLLDENGVATDGSQGYSTEFGIWLRSL